MKRYEYPNGKIVYFEDGIWKTNNRNLPLPNGLIIKQVINGKLTEI